MIDGHGEDKTIVCAPSTPPDYVVVHVKEENEEY